MRSTRLVVCAMRSRLLVSILGQSLLMLWQVFAGHPRFFELDTFQFIMAIVTDRRPPRPSHEVCINVGLDDAIWDLMDLCWQRVPAKRPSARDVVQKLTLLSSARSPESLTCDWDEAIMSRLCSSLGQDPFVGSAITTESVGGALQFPFGNNRRCSYIVFCRP